MSVIQKAITLKLFPTDQQAELLQKSFGSTRFVYNHFLGIANEGKYPGYSTFSKELTQLKSELPFLKEVDKFALQNSLRDLDDAFKRFFKRQNRYPRFKNKHKCKKSYRTNMTNGNIKLLRSALQIPKVGRLKTNKKVDCTRIVKIVSVTIKQVGSSYYAKVQVDWDNANIDIPEPKRDVLGIDLGLTDFLVASNGERIPNPKYFKVYSAKLAKLQRRAARCRKGSSNQKKLYRQIARLNQKIADSRKHFHHHLSKQITDENQVIVIETLKVKNMLQDKDYAKYISDSRLGAVYKLSGIQIELEGARVNKSRPILRLDSAL